MEPKVGLGVYTLDEAAKLIKMNAAVLRTWFRGGVGHSRVFRPDYQKIGARQPLSFLDLIDALVMSRLRQEGFSLQYLRKVHHALVERLKNKHAFATQQLVHNGHEVFIREVDLVTDKARLFELIRKNQMVHEGLLKPYLRDITFSETDHLALAQRWNIADGVFVDPAINFGAPTVAESGIAAHVLAEAWVENQKDFSVVAEWYQVDPKKVRAAVSFINTYGHAA